MFFLFIKAKTDRCDYLKNKHTVQNQVLSKIYISTRIFFKLLRDL